MAGAAVEGRLADRLGPAAAGAALLSYLLVEVYDLDVWWHLAIGREILATGALPTADRWTVLGAGRPYHDSHALFQVVLAALHRAGGWIGVQALVVALWGLTLAALWRLARRRLRPASAAALVALSGLACAERFLPRPELVTYAALAWFLAWLDEPGLDRPARLALLFLAQVAWTNAHGLFPLGPAVVAAHAAVALLRRRTDPAASVRGPLVALPVTALATLVSPFGLDGWRYALLLAREAGQGAHELIGSLGEMSSPFSADALRSPALVVFLVLLALAAAAAVRAVVRREADAGLLVAAGAAALAATGRRNVALFAVAAVPLLARAAGSIAPPARSVARGAFAAVFASFLALAALPLSGRYYLGMEIPARFGAGVTPSFFPHALAPVLAAAVPPGGILASNTLGGFVSFHGAPQRLPLTDGRWEVQDPAALLRVLRATRSGGGWRGVVRELGLRGLLLAHTSPEASAILPEVARDPEWRLVALDAAASLWLPSASTTRPPVPLDERALPRIARPEDGVLVAAFARAARSPRLEAAALERTLAFGVREEFLLEKLGAACQASGDERRAEAAYEDLLRRSPRSEAALNELAYFAWRRGDAGRAEAFLERLVAVAPANAAYRRNLERVRAPRSPESAPR